MLDAAVTRTAPSSPLARDPDALAEAANGVLTIDEQALLQRPEAQQFWSPDDIPLLDELAELMGKQPETAADRAARRRQAAEEAEQLRLAQDSLTNRGSDNSRRALRFSPAGTATWQRLQDPNAPKPTVTGARTRGRR